MGIPVRFLNGTGDTNEYTPLKVPFAVKQAAAEAVQAVNRATIARIEYERALGLEGLGKLKLNIPNPVDALKKLADEAARIAREKLEAAKKLADKAAASVRDKIQEAKEYDAATNAKHLINAGPFTAAREALKQVIKHNVFGSATLIDYMRRTDVERYKEVLKKWYIFGGDPGNLEPFINEGLKKVPRQVAPAILNKFNQIRGLVEKANRIFYNKVSGLDLGAAGIDDAVLAITAIGPAIPIIDQIVDLIKKAIGNISPLNTPPDSDPTSNTDEKGPENKKASSTTLLIGLGVVGAGILTAYALTAQVAYPNGYLVKPVHQEK